jgi:hypothetical protein
MRIRGFVDQFLDDGGARRGVAINVDRAPFVFMLHKGTVVARPGV